MSGENLYSRVKAVWRRDQILRFTEGSLVFLRWGIVLFLVAALVDWLLSRYVTDLAAPVRAAILLAVLSVSLRKAWLAGWKQLRAFNATHTALQIEEQKGGMASLLVTGLQLKDSAKRQGTSDALCELACQKAEASANDISAKDAVQFDSLRHPAIIALVVALFFGVIAVTNGPLLMAGLSRIFAPWRVASYPTRTQLELVGGDRVVQEGKPLRIAARISGAVPRRARIALRTGKGKPRLRKMPVTNSECEYEIDTAFRSFEYRVMAGDARSDWHKVDVINAPNIERAEVTLEFPEYTKRATETVEALTLTVPETTRIKWKLSLDRAVREASMTLVGEEPMPLEISEDGLTVSSERLATESHAYAFTWIESGHDFVFKSPNHYLQVAPDRPPRVELTSPTRNVYATLGRKVDLAFRGRDDHGIAESLVAYRVDKTEEEKVLFEPVKPIDGTEQVIPWDYRTVLTDLVVGQTVTFAVELTDAYPGEEGAHRVRTEARRIQFMSMEDYLTQIEKQRKRLLARLRTLYKEERKVHEVVLRLDRSDPIFVQTCQLEAVRQDLMREGVRKFGGQIQALTDDLYANGVTNQALIASLNELCSDVLRISTNNLAQSATALRSLASQAGAKSDLAHAHAAYAVNSAARELGLLVLELGFEDAADVMAREMHAAAETQATLRLRTITASADPALLAKEQERLGRWLTRLFEASPKERESTAQDALIEFSLSRIVKQMINGGIATQLSTAATLIRDGKPADAAKIQVGMIASMLRGSFRLRVGAEREALAKAVVTFASQEDAQKKLRIEIEALDDKAFKKRTAELVRTQNALHRKLQLLLMPAVPVGRWRLFDVDPREAPPTADLLGAAEKAMTEAASYIKKGDRQAASRAQANAEASFASLMGIARQRVAAITQAVRIGRLNYTAKETGEALARFGERQLSLLEKTEDAAADGTGSAYLADQEESLIDAVEDVRSELALRNRNAAVPSEHSLVLSARIADAVQRMQKAMPLLRDNTPGKAAAHQRAAIAALEDAQELLAEHGSNIGAYAGMVAMTRTAEAPSLYVREIEEEQRDMLSVTRKAKPDDMPALAIPQKNLVHAVDAILTALDPLAHMVESGIVMVFAKEDMDSAGIALSEKDQAEALDAQEYIVESLEDLRGKVDAVVPMYQYNQEVVQALNETMQEGILVREAQRRLREQASAKAAEPAVLGKEQGALKARMEAHSKLINEITGLGVFVSSAAHMAEADERLKGGDSGAAAEAMAQAEEALKADTGTLLKLMKHLGLVLVDPPFPDYVPPKEVVLAREVVGMAAQQKRVYRESYAAGENKIPGYETKLRELEAACDPFIERAKTHKNPLVVVPAPTPIPPANLHLKLVAAKGHLAKAAASAKGGDRTKALASQRQASESLRHFIVEYALKFAYDPPPLEPDETPSDNFSEQEDLMILFMPGAVTGKRPPDAELRWDVLGKRDRAALNENFARELPLEYRTILKDYYERLAK
jgi:hypothetical protein